MKKGISMAWIVVIVLVVLAVAGWRLGWFGSAAPAASGTSAPYQY